MTSGARAFVSSPMARSARLIVQRRGSISIFDEVSAHMRCTPAAGVRGGTSVTARRFELSRMSGIRALSRMRR